MIFSQSESDIVAIATVIFALCASCGIFHISLRWIPTVTSFSLNDSRWDTHTRLISPYVIAPMSSEETCLQGFPNDDIFGVIAFTVMQM